MSEASERRRLRAESREYGMDLERGLSARDLDTKIQRKVVKDFGAGVCSKCRRGLHSGNC
jgi:hypothetical protein